MGKLYFIFCLILGVSFIQASDDSEDYSSFGEESSTFYKIFFPNANVGEREPWTNSASGDTLEPTMGASSGKIEYKNVGDFIFGEDNDNDNIVLARRKK